MYKSLPFGLTTCISLVLLSLLTMPSAVHAAAPVYDVSIDFNVSSSALKSKPVWEGKCPHTFTFKGFYRMNPPTGGTSTFEHSDGSKARKEKFLNTEASRYTYLYHPTDTWQIDKSGSYWAQLHIDERGGTRFSSSKINFSVVCK